MERPDSQRWFHRYAILTACVALCLTIPSGAIVTTKDAGMAFPDYPSSDGHNMLMYPWLQSTGAKFLEHGHRLAGMLIGMLSIGLVVWAWRREPRSWVRWLSVGVLLAVITQGLLGGQRVLLNDRGLAFVHGSFAVLVLSTMLAVVLVTSRGWFTVEPEGQSVQRLQRLGWLSVITCGALYVQYMLGGLLRHQGMVLYEHMGFAFVALFLIVWLTGTVFLTDIPWLRWPARVLLAGVFLQLMLGAGAWITRFGFGDGYVAVVGSSPQVAFRTSHVMMGVILFVTSVLLSLRIQRLGWLARRAEGRMPSEPISTLTRALKLTGGAT